MSHFNKNLSNRMSNITLTNNIRNAIRAIVETETGGHAKNKLLGYINTVNPELSEKVGFPVDLLILISSALLAKLSSIDKSIIKNPRLWLRKQSILDTRIGQRKRDFYSAAYP